MNDKKIFEYNGKYYSNTDISEKIGSSYGGDLYDLYFDASHGSERGLLCEETVYYSAYNPESIYDDYEDLVADYFEDSEVSLEELQEVRENEK